MIKHQKVIWILTILIPCLLIILIPLSCHKKAEEKQPRVISNKFQPAQSIERIISLAPSFTQILYDLKLQNNIVGISSLCPAHNSKDIPRLGTFSPVLMAEQSKKRKRQCLKLKPTLIIAHSHMFSEQEAQELAPALRIVDKEIRDIQDLFEYILLISRITHQRSQGEQLVRQMGKSLTQLRRKTQNLQPKRILFVINQKPLKILGHDALVPSILHEYAGLTNISPFRGVITQMHKRDIDTLNPEIILDFSAQNSIKITRNTPTDSTIIKGNPNWLVPGTKVIHSTQQIMNLIYPHQFGEENISKH